MKKSLIALTIATCLSAGAANAGTPLTGQEKINYLKAELIAKGGVITNNDDFTKTITSPDGNHSITMDSNGVITEGDYKGITIGENHSEGDSHFLELVKANTEVGIRPPADIIIDPRAGENQHAVAFNKLMEVAGKDAKLVDNGNGTYTLAMVGKTPIIISSENKGEMVQGIKDYARNNKSREQLNNQNKASLLNRAFDAVGFDAKVTQVAGSTQFNLTFIDPVSGQERTINLNSEAQHIDLIKDLAKENILAGLPVVDPIDPGFGVGPIGEDQLIRDDLISPIETPEDKLKNTLSKTFDELSAAKEKVEQELAAMQSLITKNEQTITMGKATLTNMGEFTKEQLTALNSDQNARLNVIEADAIETQAQLEALDTIALENANSISMGATELKIAANSMTQKLADEFARVEALTVKNEQTITMGKATLTNMGEFTKEQLTVLNSDQNARLNVIEADAIEIQAQLEALDTIALENANSISMGSTELKIAANSMTQKLTAELTDLQAQIDRLNSGDEGINPPTNGVDDELRKGLVIAKEKVEQELAAMQSLITKNEQTLTMGKATLTNMGEFTKEQLSALNSDQNAQIEAINTIALENVNSISMGTTELKIAADSMTLKLADEFARVEALTIKNEQTIAMGKATLTNMGEFTKEQLTALNSEQNAQIEAIDAIALENANSISMGTTELKIAANSMTQKLTAELTDLQAQIDRLNSGDEGINPPTNGVDDELRKGLVIAKEKVEQELAAMQSLITKNEQTLTMGKATLTNMGEFTKEQLIALNSDQNAQIEAIDTIALENANSISMGTTELKIAADSMTNKLTAALAAMQAQLDAQAALIAELQHGENPQIPENGGTDLAMVDGLKKASATMQQKMGKAVDMLTKASEGLKNNKPDLGIKPPQPAPVTPFDPSEHDFGSIGNGAAKEWKTAQVDSGKAQMQEYLAGEFESFEQDLMNKFNSDMTAFQEDVQAEMDGVMASSHAISNSRPFLTNGGTAVGVGVGFSGDAQAVAIGVAHSFVDTGWSVSGSVNATTGSADTDVSAGAGVQYQF